VVGQHSAGRISASRLMEIRGSGRAQVLTQTPDVAVTTDDFTDRQQP
jgi:hypothetical protein